MNSKLMNSNEVTVSIRCTVFNHGPYLRQCLDGFVKQKTNFKFEAFVHDDASTDDSAAIILEYARMYPDIIVPLIETENLYSKRDGQFRAVTYSPEYLRGKYIAICEGDDYWTDPFKLQKQVDYLESHPECSMVFGNAIEHWEDGSHPDRPLSSSDNRVYSDLEVCWNWNHLMQTATVMYRKSILDTPLYKEVCNNPAMVVGDLPLFLTCAQFGNLYAFSDFFSVYRRNQGSYTMTITPERRLELGKMWESIPAQFGTKYTDVSVYYAIYFYRTGMRTAKLEGKHTLRRQLLNHIVRVYLKHPVSSFKRILRIFQERSAS